MSCSPNDLNSRLRDIDSSRDVDTPSMAARRCLWDADTRKAQPPNISFDFYEGDWRRVPADVMSLIVPLLNFSDVRRTRLVCRDWRQVISSHLAHLRPRAITASNISCAFPSLQHLDLKGCRCLRDDHLKGLSSISTLQTLRLDGCDGITDDVAAEIAALPRLTCLSLRQCVKVTDVTLWTICCTEEKMFLRGASSPLLLSPRGRVALLSPTRRLLTPPPTASGLPTTPARYSPVPMDCGGIPSSSSFVKLKSNPPPLELLDVAGCVLITEKGIASIPSALTGLTHLRLGGCSRGAIFSDEAMEAVGKCIRLEELDLSGCCNVSSEGLRYVGGLIRLRRLNLWNCLRLGPEGLASLAACTALTELSLRGCQQMDDSAVPHISALQLLQRLDLRACEHLRGEQFPLLSTLIHLTELNLRGCYALSDAGMAAVGSLSSLRTLHLPECWQVTAMGVGRLTGLTALQDLNLSGCRNVANAPGQQIPGFQMMRSLTSLSLRGCDRLSCGALAGVVGMKQLRMLDLSGCRDIGPEVLRPLESVSSSLVWLRLQHCMGLTGGGALASLETVTSLTALHLGGCTGLVGTALSSLRPLTALCHLSLEGCSNVPLLDRGLAEIGSACHALTHICLQGCNTMSDAGVARLGALTALRSANFGDCSGITGKGFSAWDGATRLTSLQLNGSGSVDDSGIKALAGALRSLRSLNLRHCRGVTDIGIAAVSGSLENLVDLSLQGLVGLSDVGVGSLGTLQSLAALELLFCWQFGDTGACKLTALKQLTSLDLMYSWKVSDATMHALSTMTSLVSLNIMGCHRVTGEGKAAVAHLLRPPCETLL